MEQYKIQDAKGKLNFHVLWDKRQQKRKRNQHEVNCIPLQLSSLVMWTFYSLEYFFFATVECCM